jgi:hypothetical protein
MMEMERVSETLNTNSVLTAQEVFVVYLNLISEIMATFQRGSKKEMNFEPEWSLPQTEEKKGSCST